MFVMLLTTVGLDAIRCNNELGGCVRSSLGPLPSCSEHGSEISLDKKVLLTHVRPLRMRFDNFVLAAWPVVLYPFKMAKSLTLALLQAACIQSRKHGYSFLK